MTGLAWRSLRHRPLGATATFLAVLLGTALIGSFAGVAETGLGLDGWDRDNLVIMGGVVGSWGAVIVLFSVASTVGITVTQRAGEVGLLRTIGASPRQVRRLVARETLAVAVLGAAVGAVLAAGGSRLLLGLLRGRMVADDVRYDAGPASLAGAAALVVLASAVASAVAGRRATRGAAGVVLRESAAEAGRMRWWRVAVALGLIGYGAGTVVMTLAVTRHSDDPYEAMATSGSSAILVGVGLAVLAPWLLRHLSAVVRPLAGGSAAGHLAAHNTARRSHLLAGVLGPVIVLAATATGTLMLVGIDNRTMAGARPEDVEAGKVINLLNYVVTGMISLFAAIAVVNAFAAVVAHRRAELHRLWLVGATRRQVERSVVAEAAIVAAVGVVTGAVASLFTIVPFAVARDEGLVPDGQLWLPPVVAVAVAVVTLGAARLSAGHAVRTLPAVAAR